MSEVFRSLPDYSRIWIYQADRPFTASEKDAILAAADKFTVEWTAHGNNLTAGADIFHDQFLVLSVNEKNNGASGCSIDASIRFIRSIENKYGVELLDRSKVAYLSTDKSIRITHLNDIKKEIEKRLITPNTLIFNNLVRIKGELVDQWLIPAESSWMKKYFN